MRRHGGASGKFTTTVWSFSSDVGDLLNSAGGLLGRLSKATIEPPTWPTLPPPFTNSGALRGVTMEDIREKFRDCSSQLLSEATTAEVLSRLELLEEGELVSGLADLLRT